MGAINVARRANGTFEAIAHRLKLMASPLYSAASDLLEEMMETAAERRPLGRTVLHHLIQPQLKRSVLFGNALRSTFSYSPIR